MDIINSAKLAQARIDQDLKSGKLVVKSKVPVLTQSDIKSNKKLQNEIAQQVAFAEEIFNPKPNPENPNLITNKFKKAVSSAKDVVTDFVAGGLSTTPQYGASAKPIVYSDWSPAAQHFGMDQQTAYSEHMANTAHQREVADLRAAGLNPVLGVGSGASGVSGHVATSGSSAQKSLNGSFIVDAIGATAAVVTAILTKNPAYGYMAGNAVNAVGDLFTK